MPAAPKKPSPLNDLIAEGHELIIRMTRSPSNPNQKAVAATAGVEAQHDFEAEWSKREAEAEKWNTEVIEALNPLQVRRFNSTLGKESEWHNYPDIIRGKHKTLAATIDKRIEFLCNEVLAKGEA